MKEKLLKIELLVNLALDMGFKAKTVTTKFVVNHFTEMKDNSALINETCINLLVHEIADWILSTHNIAILPAIDHLKGIDGNKRFMFNVDIYFPEKGKTTKGDRYHFGDDSGWETYSQALKYGVEYTLRTLFNNGNI